MLSRLVAFATVSLFAAACGKGPETPPQRPIAAVDATAADAAITDDAGVLAAADAAPLTEHCRRAGYKAPAGAKLALVGRQVAGGRALAAIGLSNTGTEAVCVYSFIATHEWQSDWLTIQYSDGGKYHHASRVIELDDSRDKSAPVSVLLGPGQTVWHTVDVDAWARRDRNGKEPLPAGSLYTQAAYDSTREHEVWSGKLLSEPFELLVK